MQISKTSPEYEPKPRLPIARTCARCGTSYLSYRRIYLCASCRRPQRIHTLPVPDMPLTARERQIVCLVKQAKSNKEIAYELCLTLGTVKEYMYRIFRKTRVQNRVALAMRGENGLN